MTWPLSQDYNEAIQNPATSLGDPQLKKGEPALKCVRLADSPVRKLRRCL